MGCPYETPNFFNGRIQINSNPNKVEFQNSSKLGVGFFEGLFLYNRAQFRVYHLGQKWIKGVVSWFKGLIGPSGSFRVTWLDHSKTSYPNCTFFGCWFLGVRFANVVCVFLHFDISVQVRTTKNMKTKIFNIWLENNRSCTSPDRYPTNQPFKWGMLKA